MNKIIKLPKQISDKIAAGEVVTGPISVVKELVENSIDAGADSIVVEIKDGGKSYIRITDNGTGIPSKQVELAFMPHATSKISEENDLNHIETLGFRGEALTSIAAVSKLEMITKTKDERVGTSIYIEGGDIVEKKDVGATDGTTIIVKDLFYNTPARLKFMKSDRSESTKIIDLISKISIAYPDIKIRMVNNDNILFSTNGKGNVLNNIIQVFGTESKKDLIPVEENDSDYRIKAYISPSNYTKKSRKHQIYFVNGRVVSSKTIENAISKGYSEFIFEGRYPVAYVFLDIKPEKLDVNVHPAKTEIRFNDELSLGQFIYRTINNRLKSKDAVPDIAQNSTKRRKPESPFKLDKGFEGDNNTKIEEEPEIYEYDKREKEEKSKSDKNESKVEKVNIKTLLSTNEQDVNKNENLSKNIEKNISSQIEENKQLNITSKREQEKLNISSLNVLDSVFATYILATDQDNLYIIDQHAAHERINYEQFLDQYNSLDKLSQQILEPLVISLSKSAASNMDIWLNLMNNLGYEAEIFGDKSIVIKAIPAFLELNEAEVIIKDMLDNSDNETPKNQRAIEKLIQRACKASVKANNLLKPEEIRALLNDLEECDNPYACPHGRPVFVKLGKYDVEKLFRRV